VGPHDVRRAVQEDIQVLLEKPSLRGASLADAIGLLGGRHGVEPFRTVLRALSGVALPEDEARRAMMAIEDHRAALERDLGRDPGLLVAALDRLHGVDGVLGDPVFEDARPEDLRSPAAASPEPSFDDHLQDEARRSERFHRPLSLAMLACAADAEEAWGEGVEEGLREAARDTDRVEPLAHGRLALLLPCTGPDAAVAAAERMRSVLAARSARPWTAGLSSFPVPAPDAAALITQARAALDEALRIGRTSLLYREDRRAHPRRSIGNRLSARIREDGRETEVLVEDLSLGGARIVAARRFMAGTGVELLLREHTARPRSARIVARVVRAVDAPDPEEAGSYRSAVIFLATPSERMNLAGVLADLPAAAAGPGRGGA